MEYANGFLKINKSELLFENNNAFSLAVNGQIILDNYSTDLIDNFEDSIVFNLKQYECFLPLNSAFSIIINQEVISSLTVDGFIKETEFFTTNYQEKIEISKRTSNAYVPISNFSPQRLDNLINLAAKFCLDAKSINVDTSINGGTLLGFLRNRSLIPYDDDLDLCLITHGSNIFECSSNFFLSIQQLEKIFGYEAKFLTNGQCHVSHSNFPDVIIDIFLGWIIKDKFSLNWAFINELNSDSILPVTQIKLHHTELPCFNNPYHVVEKVYGQDWSIPNKSWKISYDEVLFNKFSLLALHDNFNIEILNCHKYFYDLPEFSNAEFFEIEVEILSSIKPKILLFDSKLYISLDKYHFITILFLNWLLNIALKKSVVIKIKVYEIDLKFVCVYSAIYEFAEIFSKFCSHGSLHVLISHTNFMSFAKFLYSYDIFSIQRVSNDKVIRISQFDGISDLSEK